MWHKPQPRLYPFISASPALSSSFFPCKTYSTLSLSLPPSLACPPTPTPYPSSLGVSLFSLSQSSPPKFSLIRFGKPLANPFYPLPSTRLPASAAKHRLSIAKKYQWAQSCSTQRRDERGEKKQNKKNTQRTHAGESVQYLTCWVLPHPCCSPLMNWKVNV